MRGIGGILRQLGFTLGSHGWTHKEVFEIRFRPLRGLEFKLFFWGSGVRYGRAGRFRCVSLPSWTSRAIQATYRHYLSMFSQFRHYSSKFREMPESRISEFRKPESQNFENGESLSCSVQCGNVNGCSCFVLWSNMRSGFCEWRPSAGWQLGLHAVS